MLTLPNGCHCSNLKVHPADWEKGRQHDLSKQWYIHYRFYDPSRNGCKQVIIKGMNVYKTLHERRSAVRTLLDNELDLLIRQGYNPFLRRNITPVEIEYEIDPSTPFIKAFKKANERLTVTNRVRIGIRSVINGLEKAAIQLQYYDIPIEKLSRRHLKMLLDQCSKNSKKWSNARYNSYRGYLMMLYKELVELEAAPMNPIRDISKKPIIKTIKPTLSQEQRKLIDEYLATNFPEFRNFINLFFHSGGRKPELLQLKPGMVDLAGQKYRCVVKKGKQYREVERTIKTIAIPFWRYFLEACPADHFIFGTRFKPAKRPMAEDMPTKYWRIYIKENLGIPIDFYSLKHLNTAEVVDALDEAAAATLNAHKSTAMVINIYDVKQQQRQHNRLKDVGNSFS